MALEKGSSLDAQARAGGPKHPPNPSRAARHSPHEGRVGGTHASPRHAVALKLGGTRGRSGLRDLAKRATGGAAGTPTPARSFSTQSDIPDQRGDPHREQCARVQLSLAAVQHARPGRGGTRGAPRLPG
jgi:hypothetical protein